MATLTRTDSKETTATAREEQAKEAAPARRVRKSAAPAGKEGKDAADPTWTAKGGKVITEADAAAMAAAFELDDDGLDDAMPRRVGRPSLSRGTSAGPSPRVSVRLAGDAFAALQARAKAEHRRVSDLAREAIEAYVAK
jgi:uncharacterized protein (DUF4415 family)